MFAIIRELFAFLIKRKKFYLIPIVFLMLLIGGTLILVQGTVVAPFIYTLF